MNEILADLPGPAWALPVLAVLALALLAAAWRGRERIELVNTLGYAAITVASYGVATWALAIGLPLPLAIATTAGIEGAILTLKREANLADRKGYSAGAARMLRNTAWGFVGLSAYANLTHPPGDATGAGAVLFAAMPVAGSVLLELKAWAARTARRDGEARSPLATFATTAWRRLWATAAARVGVDVDARDTDMERRLRVRKAGETMYRLQLAQHGHVSERRVRRLERRAQQARADVGIPADADAHRAVLRHMRMLASTRDEAADVAPFEPWTPVAGGLTSAASSGRGSGREADETPNGKRTGGGRNPGREADDASSRPGAQAPAVRTVTSTNKRTSGRTGKRTSGPDVSDLIPTGQDVYRQLHEAGEPLTRDRFSSAMRERGCSVGGDRASALWRALNNGHAPALD